MGTLSLTSPMKNLADGPYTLICEGEDLWPLQYLLYDHIQRRTFLKRFSKEAGSDDGASNDSDGRIKASPLAKKLAEEKIPQYFAYPYCPDDKPFVERLIGTLEREFVQQGNLVSSIEEQQRRIDRWLDEYHNFRPHQSLGYLTPNEYYLKVVGKKIKV